MNQIRFLIVDDFSIMRRIIRGLLKELGYDKVVEAEDGQIALGMLEKGKLDFVITDINMPTLNGFELLIAIKTDGRLKHLPVLMVLAEEREEDIVLAAHCGATGYIVKPLTKATLGTKIAQILAGLPSPS